MELPSGTHPAMRPEFHGPCGPHTIFSLLFKEKNQSHIGAYYWGLLNVPFKVCDDYFFSTNQTPQHAFRVLNASPRQDGLLCR